MGNHESIEYLFLLCVGAFSYMLVNNILIVCGLDSRTAVLITILTLLYPPLIAMITTRVAPESRISTLLDRAVVPWMHLYWYIFLAAGVLNLGYLVVWLLGLS